MKQYPAIDVRTDAHEFVLAIVDDFGPTAVEEGPASIRIFFSAAVDRDQAVRALTPAFDARPVDVDDEDWARRSQENLKPITVGRVTVTPPWAARTTSFQLSAISSQSSGSSPEPSALGPKPFALSPQPSSIEVVILPSMGFGTGHHATTRLCLAALQAVDMTGRVMLDVGTGSGVLAIAADRLGAAQALGIDSDPDAIQSARENLDLNPDARHTAFDTRDLAAEPLPPSDVVTANLTGALLVRSAAALLGAVRPGGTLIVSGIQSHERDEVRQAFSSAGITWEGAEDGWVGLAVKKS